MPKSRSLPAAALIFLFLLSGPVSAAGSNSIVGLPAWDKVPSPGGGLLGVAAVAAADAWAVGPATDYRPGGLPLTLHWDGSRWTRIRNSCGYGLAEVDASASDNVWAVGGSDPCHWDGTTWTHFPPARGP